MPINESTVDATYAAMLKKLNKVVPAAELRHKADLVFEINRLKKERNAVILGHNYMEPALFHTVPDIVGDSLYLSKEAKKLSCETIIFCGVVFMAETAKILNPGRRVLIPSLKAGCSLASSISASDVREIKSRFPGAPVVTYVNTYADVKGESDICVTSANAARVLRSLKDDVVIFLPDQFMAMNLGREAGRTVVFADEVRTFADLPDGPSIIGWRGKCEVHEKFTVEDIAGVRSQFPGVAVVTHPEAPPAVVKASNYSGGTQQMVEYIQQTSAPHYLVLTECSMGDNIIAENPDKDILRLCSVRCPHMNQITLEDTLASLNNNQYEVTVPADVTDKASKAVERMLEF